MHVINLSGYLAASVQIKPVEPVKHKSILRPNVMLHYSKLNIVISSQAKLAASCFFSLTTLLLTNLLQLANRYEKSLRNEA